MVLFSLGLDLTVILPGFFFAGIGTSSASLLLDERQTYKSFAPDASTIEMCYVQIKRSALDL